MRKKGQVTIFIILGILLLAIVGLLFYFKTLTVTETFETEGRPVTVTVPQEFIAIQEYTETCLGSIAEQGLKILGQQGGYINPKDVGVYSAINPTNYDGIEFGSVSVPFWHYNSVPNGEPSVVISSLMPELYRADDPVNSIESQLSGYIKSELGNCLNSYSSFEAQGFDVVSGEMEVLTRVWDGYVDFILTYPLKVTKSGGTGELSSFYADVDVDLKNVYEVAKEVTLVQQNYTFLENQFLDVISVFSRESSDAFPPMSGISFLKQPTVSWEVSQLNVDLKQLLSSYVPLLQYYGSKNYFPYTYKDSKFSDLYDRMLENMVLPLNSSSDFFVNFDYFQNWETYLNLNGGETTIKPDNFFFKSPLGMIPFELTQQRYINTYDVSYPVLVTINDPESFNGGGFDFAFALESNIVNNHPIDASYVQPPVAIQSIDQLVCQKNQRDTSPITVEVIDAKTGEVVPDVSIELKVPNSDRCGMGYTDSEGIFESKFPTLFGGELELSKPGYLTQSHIIDTYFYRDSPGRFGYVYDDFDLPVIKISPIKQVDLSIEKFNLEKCIYPLPCDLNKGDCDGAIGRYCLFNTGSGSLLLRDPLMEVIYNGSKGGKGEYYLSTKSLALDDYEEAVVMFELIDSEESSISSDPFSVSVSLKGEETKPMGLYPGTYKMTLMVLLDQEVSILTDYRCNNDREKDCMDHDGMLLEGAIVGNTVFDDISGYFIVSPEDLYHSDSLNLRTIVQKWVGYPENFEVTVPKDFEIAGVDGQTTNISILFSEDLTVSASLTNFTKLKRSKLEPVWSSVILDESLVSVIEGGENISYFED